MRCYNFGGLISLFILCTNEEKHCFLGFSKILNFLDFFSFFFFFWVRKKFTLGWAANCNTTPRCIAFRGRPQWPTWPWFWTNDVTILLNSRLVNSIKEAIIHFKDMANFPNFCLRLSVNCFCCGDGHVKLERFSSHSYCVSTCDDE